MSLRTISVVALTLAVFGSSVGFAEEYKTHKRTHYAHHNGKAYRVGHGDGEQTKPYIYEDKRYYTDAPFHGNQTFWERIQWGQPDYPVR